MDKIIRGKVLYKYRGSLYGDQPPKTKVRKIKYDEYNNISYVILKRQRHLFEFVCAFVIIACIIFNISGVIDSDILIRYNSVVNYYNGKLYLNLYSDEKNNIDVNYKVTSSTFEYEGSLKPGDFCITVDVEDVGEDVILTLYYNILWKKYTYSFPLSISVLND